MSDKYEEYEAMVLLEEERLAQQRNKKEMVILNAQALIRHYNNHSLTEAIYFDFLWGYMKILETSLLDLEGK